MSITQLVGSSGSGLTRRLTDIYRQTEGAVMLTDDPKAHISYLRSTVAEELAFGLEQRGVARDLMWEKVQLIADKLNLTQLLDRPPNQLSGGQTRRLAIGCVAIIDAPLMLFDDPFAGLDTASRQALSQLFHTLPNDVIVAGHEAWLKDVPTEFLDEKTPELHLPTPISQKGGQSHMEFLVRGQRGSTTRKWWQFRAPRTPHFSIGPVALNIPQGGVLRIAGANGSGKTTLMRAFVGLDGATAPPAVSTALMFQDPADQILDSTVEKMVPDKKLREQFHLPAGTHPFDLSQRDIRLAQFASLIPLKPEVLCADEPDVGLDIIGRNRLHGGFAEFLTGGGCLLISCHDEGFIDEIRTYSKVHTLTLA